MIEITAKLNQPVSQLMQHISVVLHIEPETQKLFFNGEPLKRHESLLNYKISAEDTIVLEVPVTFSLSFHITERKNYIF